MAEGIDLGRTPDSASAAVGGVQLQLTGGAKLQGSHVLVASGRN